MLPVLFTMCPTYISYNTANGSYGLTILIFSPLIFIYLLGTGSHISNL